MTLARPLRASSLPLGTLTADFTSRHWLSFLVINFISEIVAGPRNCLPPDSACLPSDLGMHGLQCCPSVLPGLALEQDLVAALLFLDDLTNQL